MRRSYIDLPKRLPGAKRSLRSRGRLLPILVAVPLVVVLWLTIGLPVLAVVSHADSGIRSARQVFFSGSLQTTRRKTSRTEAVGTAEARTISTQWHPTLRLPVRVAELREVAVKEKPADPPKTSAESRGPIKQNISSSVYDR